MSEPVHVLLLGASGLVGNAVMRAAMGHPHIRLIALSRREVPLPKGARMEMLLAPVEGWGKAIATIRPDRVICALGTTIRKEGGDRFRFVSVDRDLVLRVAGESHKAGAQGFTVVSSVGADPQSKNFYLSTKGSMETTLGKIGLPRVDILRPGLLRGQRVDDRRPLEKLGAIAAPLTDLALQGKYRKYRSIRADDLAAAALQTVMEKAKGRFVHENESLMRLAHRFAGG